MDTPYVRQYAEDRELTAWLLLDRSPSMGFGPIDRPKEIVLVRARDDLRPAAHARRQPGRRDPLRQRGRGARSRRAAAGTRCSRSRGTCCGRRPDGRRGHRPRPAARDGARRRSAGARSSSSCRTSSPRRGGSARWFSWPSATRSSRSGCVDPREFELPDAGVIVVEDAETGEQLVVDSSDAEFRHRLREAGEQREAELRGATAARGRRLCEVSTDGRPRRRVRPDRRVAEAAAP